MASDSIYDRPDTIDDNSPDHLIAIRRIFLAVFLIAGVCILIMGLVYINEGLSWFYGYHPQVFVPGRYGGGHYVNYGPYVEGLNPYLVIPGLIFSIYGILLAVYSLRFRSNENYFYYYYSNLKNSLNIPDKSRIHGFFTREVIRIVDRFDNKALSGTVAYAINTIFLTLYITLIVSIVVIGFPIVAVLFALWLVIRTLRTPNSPKYEGNTQGRSVIPQNVESPDEVKYNRQDDEVLEK